MNDNNNNNNSDMSFLTKEISMYVGLTFDVHAFSQTYLLFAVTN